MENINFQMQCSQNNHQITTAVPNDTESKWLEPTQHSDVGDGEGAFIAPQLQGRKVIVYSWVSTSVPTSLQWMVLNLQPHRLPCLNAVWHKTKLRVTNMGITFARKKGCSRWVDNERLWGRAIRMHYTYAWNCQRKNINTNV